jgi:hypothetical protein
LKRGRKITLEFGEIVSGTTYWQNQGTFLVESAGLTYSRGQYPTIDVTALDFRNVWSEGRVICTEHFDDAHPEYVLSQILEDHGGLTDTDYDLPADGAMENSHKVYHQWVDLSVMQIIQEIVDHFGYMHYYDVDGKFTIKYADFDGDVDHYYTDNTKLVNYSPNDSYGSYVNQVVVKGEGLYFLEVLYNEERITQENGTMGWWGCEEQKTIYYDEDEKRTCRSPRLVVLESPTISLLFVKKGGGSITLTYEDVNETYVIVTVSAPNLIAELVAGIAAMVTLGYAALGCDAKNSCGGYIMGLSVAMELVSLILGASANYLYEIWAQPVGHEKQMFQATANDIDLQTELNGMIITQEVQDPFCYTLASCQTVADREMDVIKGQRKRVSFTKIAHLQDELADIIQIVHPHSGITQRYMIAELTRTFEKSTTPDGVGSFLDSIEGWRID